MSDGACAHIAALTTVRHARKHAKASGHPVIASAEPGERWLHCFPDDAFAEY